LKNIPIIIGENDPEGCAACSEKREPKYGYRNGTMYPVYTASSYARIYELMDKYKVNLKGAVSWSFEFENQEWFAGFRDLATNGVAKPVLNIFRMFGMMQGKRVEVKADNGINADHIIAAGVREKADINAMASKNERSVSVMVWNYHDDNVEGPTSSIGLTVDGLDSKKVLVHHYRVDSQFSNSFEKWKAMGKPQNVDAEQYKELERAGQLQLLTSPEWKETKNGKGILNFELPRQAVSLIRFTW
jgi:xylan 1,4-beta-xylosidase